MKVIKRQCYVTLEKALSSGADARFVMSATSPDRVEDTIEAEAYDPVLKIKKLVALLGHDHTKIIGYWSNFEVKAGKLIGELFLASTNLAQMMKQLIKDGVPLGASIGFRGKGEWKENGGYHFKEIELLETSVVSVPAHPKAVMIAKSFGFNTGSMPAGNLCDLFAKSGSSNTPRHTFIGSKTMTLAQKIKALQELLKRQRETLQEKTDLLTTEDDEQGIVASEIATLAADIEKGEATLDAFMTAERALIEKVKATAKPPAPVAQPYSGGLIIDQPAAPAVIKHHGLPESKQPLDVLGKIATCQFLSHVHKQNAGLIAQQVYGGDERVLAIMKSTVAGADTTTVGWAQELVGQEIAGFIEALRSTSIYAELATLGTQINFNGKGSVVMPARGATGGLAGAFVGEQGVIPVKQGSVTASTLSRFKMGVISVFSQELRRASTPQIEQVIRTGILDDTAEALDTALFDTNAAVAGIRPAGLSYNLGANSQAGAAGGGQAAVSADMKFLINVLTNAKAGRRPVLVMSAATKTSLGLMTTQLGEYLFRDEVARNVLLGIPIISSTHAPASDVSIIDAAYFASAFDTPEFDVSDTASLVMANADDTAPTHAMDNAGAIGTEEQVPPDRGINIVPDATIAAAAASQGYTAQSMFQTWQLAVRMIMPISWGMARAGVIGRVTNVTW